MALPEEIPMTKPLVALAVLQLLCVPVLAAITEPSGLAPGIRASVNEEPAFMLSASGVQIYECKATGVAPDAYAWTFVAPDATLYDNGRAAGTHSMVNHWASSSDRSSVSGAVRSIQQAGGSNLPWALLQAIPASLEGTFAGVTSIQRVNTSGGGAPVGGCDAAHMGSESRVTFNADYYFYKKRAGP
jgi:hypothetical protein